MLEKVEAGPDRLALHFDCPISAVTRGQFAVLYSGDRLLAGARIARPGKIGIQLDRALREAGNIAMKGRLNFSGFIREMSSEGG